MCLEATTPALVNAGIDTLNRPWRARISASGSSLATSLGFWDMCLHSRFLARGCSFPQGVKKNMLLVPSVPDSSTSIRYLLSTTTHMCSRFGPRERLQRTNSNFPWPPGSGRAGVFSFLLWLRLPLLLYLPLP